MQKIYVQTQAQDGAMVSGADCALSNDKGTWRLKSPGDTSVVRSNKPMEVKCEKAPLPQGVVSVESGTRGAMFGNIILGGVVGAVIDHNSGAGYEYPEIVKVVMGQMTAMAFARPPTAPSTDPSRPRTVLQPTPLQLAEPQGSGYARIDDVDVVPHLGPQGRQAYREWIKSPLPKAFALAPGGPYFPAWSVTPPDTTLPSDPSERALLVCGRNAKAPCKLYAVNNTVIWTRDAALVPLPHRARVNACRGYCDGPAPRAGQRLCPPGRRRCNSLHLRPWPRLVSRLAGRPHPGPSRCGPRAIGPPPGV